jgi:hypothetical protein
MTLSIGKITPPYGISLLAAALEMNKWVEQETMLGGGRA